MVSIDSKLLCAANWSYTIVTTGPVPPSTPYDTGSGLSGPVTGFARGDELIDAALVGRQLTPARLTAGVSFQR
jgi:hypothetical protein